MTSTATDYQYVSDDLINSSSISSVQQDCRIGPRWGVLALVMFTVIGAVGNSLVCIAIFTERKLQNVTNYFLFSLAAVDLLVSLIVMPFSILTELHHGLWPYGFTLCAGYTYSDVFLCSASIVHMSIISIDRYLGISHPLKTRNKSKLVVLLKITAAWVITSAISCPIIILALVSPSDIYQDGVCIIDNSYFLIYGSTLAFLIPCLIMAATYIRTTQLLRQQAVTCGSATGSNRSAAGSGRSANGEGLRRNHVRRTKSLRTPQGRQRICDVGDGEDSPRNRRFNSPTIASQLSAYCNNNNIIRSQSLRRSKSPGEKQALNARTSVGYVRTIVCDQGIHHSPHQSTSRENKNSPRLFTSMDSKNSLNGKNNTVIAVTPLQASTASSTDTFRSRFKARTKNLWNRTTRRATPLNDLASEEKATRVLGLVFVCFCVCWTPFFVHNFTQAFCADRCRLPRWIPTVFLWLGYISSTINPIIYTAFNERFRAAFARIIACQCRTSIRRRDRFNRLSDRFSRISAGESVQTTNSTAANYGFTLSGI